MKQNQLLLLLALLITAATGAWAQSSASVYSNALNKQELFDRMTNIDANGDGTNGMNGLWLRHDNLVTYNHHHDYAADDWLVTPAIDLQAGVTYTIAIDAIKPAPQEHIYTETFEVKVGTDATAANLSAGTAVIATTEVTTSWTNYHRTFTPTTSGIYYVGIHATSPKDQSRFSIRNLTVDIKYYTVNVNDGELNPTTWKAKVGDATEFGALPLEGVTEGQTVTLQYNGQRRVRKVTATVYDPKFAVPLTMEVIADGTIKVNIPSTNDNFTGMKYSLDGGQTKTEITSTTTIDNLKAGDKVQFYGIGTSNTSYGDSPVVTISGGTATVKVYGNIMSLFDEDGFATNSTLPDANYVLYGLFKNNTSLTDASGLLLPATELKYACYQEMFSGCSNLEAGPVLPAPTLYVHCYFGMFYICSKLASVTCLATSGINTDDSTSNWLNGAGTNATGTKTFTADPTATWPSGNSGIPEGWTRLNPDGTEYVAP